jgi:SAM-dependent methyltransferase
MTSPDDAATDPPTGSDPLADAEIPVRLLPRILDAHSTEVLRRAGIAPGWHCLELGAGAGTISDWLADQVGPHGRVVALDTDLRYLPPGGPVDVRHADVTDTDLGTGRYHLIHARLLLMHLPWRTEVLRRAVRALRPGGVLVVSDWDYGNPASMLVRAGPAVREAFDTYQSALLNRATADGVSRDWARCVPLAMDEAGLVDVDAQVHNRLWRGGEPGCLLHASTARHQRSALLAGGVHFGHLEVLVEAMTDPYTLTWGYPVVTSTGRRPG